MKPFINSRQLVPKTKKLLLRKLSVKLKNARELLLPRRLVTRKS